MSTSRKSNTNSGGTTTRNVRIFIVEDEILVIRGLEEALERLGYCPCGFATSAEHASREIQEKRPDLVLVDIYLEGKMDGIDLAKLLYEQHSIPVIYLTAYSDSEILQRVKQTNPFGYIVKPFRDSQLKVDIELALERYTKEQEKKAWLENTPLTPLAAVKGKGQKDGIGIHLDEDALDRLFQTLGNRVGEMLPKLVNDLCVQTARMLSEAREALTEGRLADLERIVLTIKSNSRLFGAVALSEKCRELESEIRKGGLEHLPHLLDLITNGWEEAKPSLETLGAGVGFDLTNRMN